MVEGPIKHMSYVVTDRFRRAPLPASFSRPTRASRGRVRSILKWPIDTSIVSSYWYSWAWLAVVRGTMCRRLESEKNARFRGTVGRLWSRFHRPWAVVWGVWRDFGVNSPILAPNCRQTST